MDGYEFETLIGTLLKNIGFIVENTPLSGDGGIDIIATSKEPFFKGQYLIQCKYWSSPVGEPSVRDLYGVVMDRNAIKGVIITNSTFSDKAIEFAENKNIELIDGTTLNSLLDRYLRNEKLEISSTEVFTDLPGFQTEKYNYLIKRIEHDKTNKSAYETLLNFYIEQLQITNSDILKAGLLTEMIDFIQEYIKRFCKRTKTLLHEKKALQLILSHLYILNNNLPAALELIQDIGLLIEKPKYYLSGAIIVYLPEFFSTHGEVVGSYYQTKIIKKTTKSFESLIFLNLYQIFNEISYTNGINFIENKFESFKSFSLNQIEDSSWEARLINLNLKEFDSQINALRNKKFNKYYIPSSIKYDSKNWSVKTDDSSCTTEVLFMEFLERKKLESQVPIMDLILN